MAIAFSLSAEVFAGYAVALHQLPAQHPHLPRGPYANAYLIALGVVVRHRYLNALALDGTQGLLRIDAGIEGNDELFADAAAEDERHGSLPCDQ